MRLCSAVFLNYAELVLPLFYLSFSFLDSIPKVLLGRSMGTSHTSPSNSYTPRFLGRSVGTSHTLSSNSHTPRIQLSSNTNYPNIMSDSTGRVLSPTRISPLPIQMPVASLGWDLGFWLTGYRGEVLMSCSNSRCQS